MKHTTRGRYHHEVVYHMKLKALFFVVLFFLIQTGFSQPLSLWSPDKKLSVSIQPGDRTSSMLTYDMKYNGEEVLADAVVGFEIAGFESEFFLSRKPEKNSVSKSWQPVYGERRHIADKYNALTFTFKSPKDGAVIKINCRLYNEGFAYRYEVINLNEAIVLKAENSSFPVSRNATAWVTTTAQGVISEKKVNEIAQAVERPLVVNLQNNIFLGLGEAALVNFSRMKFRSDAEGRLVSQLHSEVKTNNMLTSPWRYVMAAGSPAELLEKNYFILNLNEPNAVRNTSWIKPGKVLREVTLTTAGAMRSIDFASNHNISYVLFDAGWYGREDHDTSDATRVSLDPARSKGPLDLKKVIEYANAKNTGILLYVNRRALERQLDTLLPLYQSWGVKGIKFGFVQVGNQEVTSWLHHAVRKAAEHQMLVDIHDEYRPTGYSRTYPNLLTQEGIRGDEESPDLVHTITTIFTRMIAGAGDHTICYFNNRVDKMGSHAAQLAKAVCVYSPLQFLYWYDRPMPDSLKTGREGEIIEVPELSFFNAVPTVWDETRVLEADMKQYATIARKSNNDWFIGSLNGEKERTVNWSCNFLDKKKKYRAIIYTDDETVNTPTKVKVTEMDVDHRSVLKFTIGAKNGVAVHIKQR
jgi:alpha-glucosidase